MPRAKHGLVLVGLLGIAGLVSRCETVPLTAPAGSSIFLQANPAFVPANGGRSVVTALVVEPAGTLVPDATEVLFLTNLGTIDETAKTVDGIARVYFVSDARSGTATITAMSGGPAAAPSASPSTSPSPTPTATPVTGGGASGAGAQASVTITVGSALPTRVVVGANPQRITSPRQATIVANVFDASGNPVQNVPVIFKIDSVTGGGSPTTTTTSTTTTTIVGPTTTTTTTTTTTLPSAAFEERLASGGSPRFTDSNGQAFDTLSTTAPAGGVQREVVVSATTSNGVSGTVTVAID